MQRNAECAWWVAGTCVSYPCSVQSGVFMHNVCLYILCSTYICMYMYMYITCTLHVHYMYLHVFVIQYCVFGGLIIMVG